MKHSEIVNRIHSIIIVYLMGAWIIESQRQYLVLFLPSLQFQFLINNNECILTQFENKLLEDEKKEDDDEINNESFIDNKFKQYGINLDPTIREYIIHGSVYASFLISYYLM
jgi:hypothetical protein